MKTSLKDFADRILLGFLKNILPLWVIAFFLVKFLLEMTLGRIVDELTTSTIIYICLPLFTVVSIFSKWFKVVVPPNKCLVYQNRFTGSLNPKWPGFNWVGVLEYLPGGETFTVDTQKHNTTTKNGTWDAVDDTLVGKWTVLWRIDIEDIKTRNNNVKKYIKATMTNIGTALEVIANDVISSMCFDAGNATAAKQIRSTLLTPEDFDHEAEQYGIEILNAKVEDLDYSETTQQANELNRKLGQIPAMVRVLMTYHATTNPHPITDSTEAYRIAKAQLLGGNYKQIETGANLMVTP